ncbi:hypothetical protein Tco_0247183 [Tanacetum coccineum]
MDKITKQDTSSRSGNDAHVNDANIRPIYNEEPMAEVQTTDDNVSATRQQHTEQPEFNNEGKVDQNAEQCHDIRPLPAKLTEVMKAKVKHDIDVIETINIELEHKVAKLLKENETLKRHYKEMFDSIKTTRAKNIEHTTSLIANNDKFKAQIQEKGLPDAAIKMGYKERKQGIVYSLKYRYIVQSYKGRTPSLVVEKTDISENRASRNFDLMIIKWRLLKITLAGRSHFWPRSSSNDIYHNVHELGITPNKQ